MDTSLLISVLLLGLCAPVRAQIIGKPGGLLVPVASAAAASDIPTLQGTIALRWNQKDLSGTQAVGNAVTNWADRIANNQAIMMNTPWQPTNAALGVHFSGSDQWLTNKPTTFTTDNRSPIMVIYQADTGGSFGQLLGDGDTGSGQGFRLESSQTQWWWEGTGGKDGASMAVGVYQDIIYCGDPLNAGTYTYYTNGVQSRSVSSPSPPGLVLKSIGQYGGAGSGTGFKGYIPEIIVWANSVGPFNATAISNLHYYRTNTWGGTP